MKGWIYLTNGLSYDNYEEVKKFYNTLIPNKNYEYEIRKHTCINDIECCDGTPSC